MNSNAQPEIHQLAPDATSELPAPLAHRVGFTGLDPWLRFVHHIYDFPIHRFSAHLDGQVVGWLALAEVKHPIFGHFLTTSPFGSYGGFAYNSNAVRDGLLESARVVAAQLGVAYTNVRFDAGDETPPAGWLQQPLYATYLADLAPDFETRLQSYSPNHRNHVRKAFKKGFSIRFGHLDLLEPAYEGLARSMHELGSPYHSRDYLRKMAEALGPALEFAVVYDSHGQVAGAGVFVFQGPVVTNLHANILQKYRPNYAGEFFYGSLFERYHQLGYKVFDLGRSLIGSGNEVFKSKWQPRKRLLAYWYALAAGQELPALNQKNPKFQLAIRTWQRLPTFVVRPLGPFLIQGLA